VKRAANDPRDPAPPETPSRSVPYRRRVGARSDLTLVRGILSKALAYKGLDKKVERYEFILHWREIVGDKIADIAKPEYISRRALIVSVKHSAWAQELNFMKPVLLQKLAPYLNNGDIVSDMVFRVGSQP
jgi:predicted nucleic acid-binding Zn ribbon protein